ncbi:MAG: ACT domain-containing protein [Ruminococcus sp.]|nr:ACT domain-containing protein [Ruminococcus sp.]
MTVKQLSVFAENRPGRLSAITGFIAEAGINIRAISVADTKDFGIMRIIVDDTEKALKVLRANNCSVTQTNVIAVTADDTPGGMASIMETLYKDNISVEYMYSAFINPSKNVACLIVRVDNNDAAVQALGEAGFKLVSEQELLEF